MSLSACSEAKVKAFQLSKNCLKSMAKRPIYEHKDGRYRQQTSKLLEGLGKATKRGVRACPKCGITNGTRRLKCKNGECEHDFKQISSGNVVGSVDNKLVACAEDIDETELSRNFRVLRLLSDERFYFVERILNSSGDLRDWGFVHLPLLEEVNALVGMEDRSFVAYQLMAFCYMRDCTSSTFQAGKIKGQKHKEKFQSMSNRFCCDHVKAAFLAKDCINSFCRIDQGILDCINLPKEIKLYLSKLTCLETEANPVVQKISYSLYVVRGMPDKKHSVGYSYVLFSKEDRESVAMDADDDSFLCPENTEESSKVLLTCWCGLKLDVDFFKEPTYQPCFHLFACLLALSSDPFHSEACSSLLSAVDEYYKQVNLVQESLLQRDLLPGPSQSRLLSSVSMETDSHRNKLDPSLDGDVLGLLHKVPKSEAQEDMTFGHIITDGQLSLLGAAEAPTLDDACPVMSVDNWMSFVIESIGEAMHYGCSGKPPPLVFHVPQKFFANLMDRITTVNPKKKRLPDSMETISISPPLPGPHGKFTKYVWNIHCRSHVQKIFSTSLNKLELYKFFVENEDGTCSKFEKPPGNAGEPSYGKPHIRPLHLITQLKIGRSPQESHSSGSTPFTIEWTPDLYKRTRIGEMKLKFEFCHFRHGKLVKCCT